MKNHFKYILLIVFILLVFVGYLLLKPFLAPILTSIVIAYLFYPFYNWIQRRIKNKVVASILASVIIILLITIPGFLILKTLTREAYISYFIAKQNIFGGSIGGSLTENCIDVQTTFCNVVNEVKQYWRDPQVQYYLQDGAKKVTDYVINSISGFIFTIPKRVLEVFIMFFMIYYLFKDGEQMVDKIRELIPLKKKYQEQLFHRIKDVSYAIVYGNLIVALIQGALGALGFYFFGLHSPILWGLIMAFFAFLPLGIGAAFIWLPAGLMVLFNGYVSADSTGIWKGIGLLVYGALIVSTIDNFIRPKIVGDKGHIHPIVVLLGVFGGLTLFGFIGIVVGPLILAILLSFTRIYIKEI